MSHALAATRAHLLVALLFAAGCTISSPADVLRTSTSPAPSTAPTGDPCGGKKRVACPAGQYCELPVSACNAADLEGICKAQPRACVKLYLPVCGCDGKTYGNDCERQAAGAQKRSDGACPDRR